MPANSLAFDGELYPPQTPAVIIDVPASMPRGRRHGVYLLGNDDPLWGRLDQDETISIYRKKAWKEVIETTYRHPGEYVAAFENGVLRDILPFFLIKDPLKRKKLISTPYQGSNGGFMTGDSKVRRLMIEFVKDFAHSLKVQYVEIRSSEAIPELDEAGFVAQKPLLTSIVPLSTPEKNWELLTPKHRRNVRYAEKSGVTVHPATRRDEMTIFYVMLQDHYKSLGVPFPGEAFFQNMWDKLVTQGHGMLLLARHGNEVIGGHLVLYNGTTLVSKFSVTRHHERYARLYAAYALYWEAIRLGAMRGLTAFDLGVTGESNTGLREFKSRLGASERPLYFYYYRLSGTLPDYKQYYSSYKLARWMWKIAPKAVTTPVGALINRWIC